MTVWVSGVTSPVSGLVTCGVNCRVVEQPSRAVTGQVSGSGIVPPPADGVTGCEPGSVGVTCAWAAQSETDRSANGRLGLIGFSWLHHLRTGTSREAGGATLASWKA